MEFDNALLAYRHDHKKKTSLKNNDGTNTLAYFRHAVGDEEKSFIRMTPDGCSCS
jgi:hypothetical protein